VVMPAGKQEALQKKQAQARARTQPWRIQSRIMSAQEEKQVEWDKMERFWRARSVDGYFWTPRWMDDGWGTTNEAGG
jgi:hypothetical protein